MRRTACATSAMRASPSRMGENMFKRSFAALWLVSAIEFTAYAQCGVERWSVKTGTDADAGHVNLATSTATTIGNLIALQAPANPPANNRVQPTETTVFVLNATLTEYKLES